MEDVLPRSSISATINTFNLLNLAQQFSPFEMNLLKY